MVVLLVSQILYTMKQNYKGVPKILLDRYRVV